MVMKKIALLLLFFGSLSFSKAQFFKDYGEEYHQKFNEARGYLGKGNLSEAFVILQGLYQIDSLNNYTNYLLGVCYTEQNIVTKNSIKHLNYAKENILTEYKYIPYTETRAPIFAWYYLCKAYSQNGMCSKSRWAKEHFLAFNNDFTDNKYFTNSIDKFMISCNKTEDAIRNKERKESVVTKEIEYTTFSSLYGVQVGAFQDLVPIREEFDDLKNVEAFMDTSGVLRYVVGHFSIRSQADKLLEAVKLIGYKDAFIVNVNEVSRFSNEVIIVDNMSFKTHIMGRINFRVQIGVFKEDSIPQDLAELYLKIEDINEVYDNELTILQVGNCKVYSEAVLKKDELIKMGVPGPFIVAYDSRQKISVKAAKKYIARQKSENQEKISKEDDKKYKKYRIKENKDKNW
jgi:hypothetical protein